MGETAAVTDFFSRTRVLVDKTVSFLESDEANALTHSELEDRITVDGREIERQLYQDHLDLRALREVRLGEVTDAEGVTRRAAEPGHVRALETVVGEVFVLTIT